MKKNPLQRTILVALLLVICSAIPQTLKGNEPPSILQIFDKYGYSKGVTTLEISKELSKKYKINIFRSIVFENGRSALPQIRSCITRDKVGALKIKEKIQDGLVVNGYYRLKSDNLKINRYLIFKVTSTQKVTLLYIEGELTPEELVELLK